MAIINGWTSLPSVPHFISAGLEMVILAFASWALLSGLGAAAKAFAALINADWSAVQVFLGFAEAYLR